MRGWRLVSLAIFACRRLSLLCIHCCFASLFIVAVGAEGGAKARPEFLKTQQHHE